MANTTQAEVDALVLLAQSGDENALSLLYEIYHPRLLCFAFQFCHDASSAGDVVQDVWLKSVTSIRRLDDPRVFTSWLFKAVKWRCIDHIRGLKVRQEYEEKVQDSAHSTDEDELGNHSDVSHLIKQLPDIEREVIYLFYQEELLISEIALVQGVPQGTIKSRLNRARNRIRQQLENEDGCR